MAEDNYKPQDINTFLPGQFTGIGMYDEGGKFAVDPTAEDRLRAEAEAKGLRYSGDVGIGPKFLEFAKNIPDAGYEFFARGFEGLGELAVGTALAGYKGGRLLLEPDPEKRREIMAEPAFTKYMGEFRGKLGSIDLAENTISGITPEQIANVIGYYAGPPSSVIGGIVKAPFLAAKATQGTKAAAEGTTNIVKDVVNVATKGDSGFRTSAGGVRTVDEMINEGVVTTGSKYYDDLGGFDDIVTRNVLINKNNRLSDILTGGSSSNRKDRLALRYQASKNKDLNEFVNKVNKLEKTKKIDDSIFNQFADIYNSKDFFKLQYLKNSIGKNKYAVLRDKAKLIPAEEGGITKETLDEVTEMFNSISTKQPKMDVIVTKAENVLKKYKDKNLKATGYELKGNALGDVNIENILFEDKILKEYLTTGTGKEITERGSLLSKKKELIKTLNKQGILEELGLSNYNITGKPVKKINDPQIKEYLKKVGKDNVGKDFDFTKAMNSDQRLIITEAITKVGNLTKGQPAVNKAVYSLMDKNIERMFRYGLREGKTMDEILKSFKNQIDDPDFLNKVVPLMIEKAKTGNYIKGIRKDLGVTLDDVNLSHMTAVVDDIDQTFNINNLFIGKSSLNQQESNIQKTIKKLQNNLKKDNISSSEKLKAKEQIEDLQFELENKGYYESISKNYPSASDVGMDVQKQIKEKISETMMGEPTYFKKDGGMVGISHLTRPL
jgi:hypothetical protein